MVGVPVVVRQPNVHEGGVVTKSQEPGHQMTARKDIIEECMTIQMHDKLHINICYLTPRP